MTRLVFGGMIGGVTPPRLAAELRGATSFAFSVALLSTKSRIVGG